MSGGIGGGVMLSGSSSDESSQVGGGWVLCSVEEGMIWCSWA